MIWKQQGYHRRVAFLRKAKIQPGVHPSLVIDARTSASWRGWKKLRNIEIPFTAPSKCKGEKFVLCGQGLMRVE